MKWIKASERLPKGRGRFYVKIRHKKFPEDVTRDIWLLQDGNPVRSAFTLDQDWWEVIYWLDESPDSYREALEDLIFTAQKLWDEVKPIKDSEGMAVTHPVIEAARTALGEKEVGNG